VESEDEFWEAEAVELLRELVGAFNAFWYEWPDYGGPPKNPTPKGLKALLDRIEQTEDFLDQLP
jgi:hypothetical protein